MATLRSGKRAFERIGREKNGTSTHKGNLLRTPEPFLTTFERAFRARRIENRFKEKVKQSQPDAPFEQYHSDVVGQMKNHLLQRQQQVDANAVFLY